MDKRVEHIEALLQKLADSLHSIDKTLVRQEENLKEHMRRTEAAEKRLEHLHSEIEPVKKHVAAVNTILKAIGWLGGIGVVGGVVVTMSGLISNILGK